MPHNSRRVTSQTAPLVEGLMVGALSQNRVESIEFSFFTYFLGFQNAQFPTQDHQPPKTAFSALRKVTHSDETQDVRRSQHVT